MKKLKPKLTNNLIQKLNPQSLEYFCKTSEIDREVCQRKGITFNEDLAKATDANGFYFICSSGLNYGIVSHVLFDEWVKRNEVNLLPVKSSKAEICINDFISKVHNV